MKVCFLEPTANVLGLSTYAAHNVLEPLGIEMLAAYVERHGFVSTIVQQRCKPRDVVLSEIEAFSPDVLAITTLTYNIDDSMWFARAVKKRFPALTVVLGGYHVTAVPETAMDPDVDFIVVGEGEIPLLALLKALKTRGDTTCIPGVGFAHDGALKLNARGPTVESLDDLPLPHRSADILRQSRMHGLMYPPPSKQLNVATVSASRGCPHACAFCSSTLIWNREVRARSPVLVADELTSLHEEYDVNAVFFCDLTFNASKRYTLALCDEIARRDLPVHFYAMCTLTGMDAELAQAMKRAKCTKVGFGIESFTPETRKGMKDGGGMDIDSANRVLDIVTAAGILAKAYFIIGFPWETRESLNLLCRQVSELHADEIKVTFYVPFPGTRGFTMHQELLTTRDWSHFTTLSEPIVRNDHLTAEEIKTFRQTIFNSFYRGACWQSRCKTRSEASYMHRQAFDEFNVFLREKGIVGGEHCG